MKDISSELLYLLAKDALMEYNNDLLNNREDYLKFVVGEILGQYQNLDEQEILITSLTSVCALMVENFFLNKKLLLLEQNT